LAHAVATADAQVVDQLAARLQVFQGQQVSLGQVVDVDVIADAGAVGGGVVGAEDVQVRPLADGGLDHQRDQVRLGPVVLANVAGGAGARGVEVAQGRVAPPVGAGEVGQGVLDRELGVA